MAGARTTSQLNQHKLRRTLPTTPTQLTHQADLTLPTRPSIPLLNLLTHQTLLTPQPILSPHPLRDPLSLATLTRQALPTRPNLRTLRVPLTQLRPPLRALRTVTRPIPHHLPKPQNLLPQALGKDKLATTMTLIFSLVPSTW